VAKTVLPEVGYAITGQGAELSREKRQRMNTLQDRAIQIKATALQEQLDAGRKYGTLTPLQQQQLQQQIEGLYAQPMQGPSLVQRLHKIVHPNATVAAGPQAPAAKTPLAAFPSEGTLTAEAKAKAIARPQNTTTQALDTYTEQKFGTTFSDSTAEQQEEAFNHVSAAKRAPRIRSAVVIDKSSPTGFSSATWDVTSGQVMSTFPGILPPRGFIPTATVSHSTDQYGNTTSTVSERTPQIPGTSRPGPHDVAAAQQHQASEDEQAEAPAEGQAKPATGKKAVIPKVAAPVTQAAPAGPRQLDPAGHIPELPGINPQVREFAQQLIDDRDVDKIPAKARAPAAALARQFGWEQGKFTPKEQVMLREAATFLQEGINNPALAALDGGTWDRLKMAQASLTPEKEGIISRTATLLSAKGLNSQQQEYARWYKQMVGTISGLAQLVRSGRATEATIERLVAELPNPYNTVSSADARNRLQRLVREINIAMQKGSFTGTEGAGGTGPGAILPQKSPVIVVSPEDMK
jgi:hypothetical protein